MDYFTEDWRGSMNRVICVKGHFYDGDKYSTCPHCADGAAPIEPDHFAVAKGTAEEPKEAKKEKNKESAQEP